MRTRDRRRTRVARLYGGRRGRNAARTGGRPLEHLQVAIGVAKGHERAATDELVDGDGLACLVVDKVDFRQASSTGPLRSAKRVFTDEPITCSGGTP